MKPKLEERKIKIRGKINKTETKKTRERINKIRPASLKYK